jgi:hypothetical protein
MKAKEARVARGASPFIMKADVSSTLSPIIKARTSPFIMKADVSLIPNIETHIIKERLGFVCPL